MDHSINNHGCSLNFHPRFNSPGRTFGKSYPVHKNRYNSTPPRSSRLTCCRTRDDTGPSPTPSTPVPGIRFHVRTGPCTRHTKTPVPGVDQEEGLDYLDQ